MGMTQQAILILYPTPQNQTDTLHGTSNEP